ADGKSNHKHHERFRGMGVETPPGSMPPSDPKLILDHMDRAAIYAAVLFGPTRKWKIDDPELRRECYRAYNDFVMELDGNDPNRIVALPVLPTSLPEFCRTELRRLIDHRVKAVEFPVWDVAEPVQHETWDPIWEMAASARIPVCSHIGDAAGTPYPPQVRGLAKAHFSTAPTNIMKPMAQMVFSGAFERNPQLRYMYSECNVGWVPYFIEWMDRQERVRGPLRETDDAASKLSMPPSEYFKRQIRVTFEDDPVGGRMIREGWHNLSEISMWGADYPHNYLTWPNPQKLIDELLAGVEPGLRHDVVFGRMARFFNIEAPGGLRT
ncbi:MAG: amidohydrolase family protein, partial [Steroidobacteraceae bacterium]